MTNLDQICIFSNLITIPVGFQWCGFWWDSFGFESFFNWFEGWNLLGDDLIQKEENQLCCIDCLVVLYTINARTISKYLNTEHVFLTLILLPSLCVNTV